MGKHIVAKQNINKCAKVALWGQGSAPSPKLTVDVLKLILIIAVKKGVSVFISKLLFFMLHVSLL